MRTHRILNICIPVSLALSTLSCSSIQSPGEEHPLVANPLPDHKGYVEVWVEQVGPASKWAGPKTVVLHVTAKKSAEAHASLFPRHFWAKADLPQRAAPLLGIPVPQRKIASEGDSARWTGHMARDQIEALALRLDQTPAAEGCLSPVRVRFLKENGKAWEKTACRGTASWNKEASTLLSQWMEAAIQEANPKGMGKASPDQVALAR